MKKIFVPGKTAAMVFILMFTFFQIQAKAAGDRYSVASGDWNDAATWAETPGGTSGASVPTAAENVFIEDGFTVTVGLADAACNDLSIAFGSVLSVGDFYFNVDGITSVSGTLTYNNSLSAILHKGLVTINPGGTWNDLGDATITFNNGINNSGDFNSGAGIYTFSGNPLSILTGTIAIINIEVTSTITNTGSLTCETLSGAGELINAATGTLFFSGSASPSITTLTATAPGNTVNYNGGTQNCKVTVYDNLTVSNTFRKTFAATPTVNGILSLEGTASIFVTGTGVVTYGPTATLKYNKPASYNATSEEWVTPFTATGGVVIANTGTITLNGDKVFSSGVPLTINNGAMLNTGTNRGLTFGGDFINGGILTANASPIVITNAATQNIAGFTTTGSVSITKTSGTATFTGNVNGGALSLNGAGGTLNLGSGLTHTFTGNVTLTAGTLHGGSSTLNENSVSATAWDGDGSLFTPGTGTVSLGAAGAQSISATTPVFNNLTLTGGGTKTFLAATPVGGNLSIASGSIADLGTYSSTANTMTLAGGGVTNGIWGSTASTATFKNNTYFAATTGTVTVSTSSCSVLSAPTASITQPTCAFPTGTISIATQAGVDYSIDGTTWQISNVFSGVAPGTYTIYVRSTTSFCTSSTGGQVVIAPISSAPTGNASQTFCSGATVSALAATGTAIQWYAASSGGTALPTSTVLVDGTHYYASQTEPGLCESTSRFDVTATIITTPVADAGPPTDLAIQGVPYTFPSATATNGTISWAESNVVGLFGYTFTGTNTLHPVFTSSFTGFATFTLTTNTGCGIATDAITLYVLGTDPIVWTGAVSEDWNNTANWSTPLVPSTNTNVSIPVTSSTRYPVINASAACKNITIASGASLADRGTYLTVSGTATVKRDIIAANWTVAGNGWHLISSPVASQAISGAWTPSGTGNDYDFYSLDEANTTEYWLNQKVPANGISSFVKGSGYLVAYQQADTKVFTGSLNNGNVTISGLTYTPASSYPGFHLVGNPFASAIDWNTGSWTRTNIDANAYIWNNGSYTSTATNNIIPSMNGFMVHVNTGSGTLIIPSDSRISSLTPWYKSSESNEMIVLNANDIDGGILQSSIVRFNQEATNNFDSDYDSYFVSGFAPLFYSVTAGNNLLLNTLPEMSSSLVVPFTFIKNGSSHFSIELAKNLPNTTLYLKDKKTNTIQNLTETPTYTFTSEATDDPARFELSFLDVTGVTKPDSKDNFTVYQSKGNINITCPANVNAEILVTNLVGQVVMRGKTNGNALTTLNAGTLQNGVYVVSLVGNNKVISKKLVVSK